MESSHLVKRLLHPHYICNVLLSLPLPLLLLFAAVDARTKATLLAGPLFLITLVLIRDGGKEAETNVEMVTWNLRVFNAFGLFFTREWLGLRAIHVGLYLLVWLAISFVFPQPPYLGPSKLTSLNAEKFDERVLLIPPISSFSSSPEEKITEMSDDVVKSYDAKRRGSKVWNVVLLHAEWSRTSRELQIALSRMSCSLGSSTLAFYLITPETAPQPFYDLNLATHATSLDLPLIALYHQGRLISQLPRGPKQIQADRRARKAELRSRGLSSKVGRKVPRNAVEESESGSETDESEDEREVEREVARERYRWKRTAESVEKAFGLKEKSEGKKKD